MYFNIWRVSCFSPRKTANGISDLEPSSLCARLTRIDGLVFSSLSGSSCSTPFSLVKVFIDLLGMAINFIKEVRLLDMVVISDVFRIIR